MTNYLFTKEECLMFKRGIIAGIALSCLSVWVCADTDKIAEDIEDVSEASEDAGSVQIPLEMKDPQVLVDQKVIELASALLAQKSQIKEKPELLVDLINTIVMPIVDDTRMAKLALGKNWKKLDEKQKGRFKVGFKDLLIDAYSAAFLAFDGEEIKYDATRFDDTGKRAIVKSRIMLKGRAPVNLDYKMFVTKNQEWLMYDVTVAGVGLIQAYRNVFGQEIKRVGVEQMIINLETKQLGK